jgi:hypothetical protein
MTPLRFDMTLLFALKFMKIALRRIKLVKIIVANKSVQRLKYPKLGK